MQTLASRDTVAQLLADWAWANDTEELGLIADILTPDASFSVAIAGETVVGPLSPREDIVAFIGEALAAQTGQRRHCVSNVRVGDDGFTAYLTIFETADGESSLVSTGIYRGAVQTAQDGAAALSALTIELDRPF